MDEPWPDASNLAPHQQQKPEAANSMQYENEPLLWMARYQADNACYEGDYCGERNAPVGEARRHKRRSFSGCCSLLLPKSRQTLIMSIPYLSVKNNAIRISRIVM